MSELLVKERPILFSGAMVRALLAGTKTQTRRTIKPQPQYDADMLGGVYMFAPPKGVGSDTAFAYAKDPTHSSLLLATCPFGQAGERLYVREAYRTLKQYDHLKPSELPANAPIACEADGLTLNAHWGRYRHGRFMPRAASRLLLEITAVRVERVQAISEADAVAEGIEHLFTQAQLDEMLRRPGPCPWNKAEETGWLNYLWHGHRDLTTKQIDNWPYQFSSYDSASLSYSSLWAKINGSDSWAANPWVWVVEFKVLDGKEAACA